MISELWERDQYERLARAEAEGDEGYAERLRRELAEYYASNGAAT